MAKKQKPIDKLTKPELLALCKRLHKRIERLEAQLAPALQNNEMPKPLPWETTLNDTVTYAPSSGKPICRGGE